MTRELLTPDGRVLEIGDVRPGDCIGCGDGEQRSVLPLSITTIDHQPFPLALCGGCLAEALAILLGRRHVQRGGELGDLRFPT